MKKRAIKGALLLCGCFRGIYEGEEPAWEMECPNGHGERDVIRVYPVHQLRSLKSSVRIEFV